MTETAAPLQPDYRKITDSLAGALDRLAEKRAVMETCQVALNKAQTEHASAVEAAWQVQATLQVHLNEVLPIPNRRT